MIYVDTSVLIALFLNESKSSAVCKWYNACDDDLISAAWCVTEFASALGIKQRTGQINSDQRQYAWRSFGRLCTSDLKLMPVEHATFHQAAQLMLSDVSNGLRVGDALPLASAMEMNSKK